ncbi:MAG: hypothetical protein HQ541_04895 [Mariniphaga sp.]|nr:hypothetical protein [Mariniphaga sp.]
MSGIFKKIFVILLSLLSIQSFSQDTEIQNDSLRKNAVKLFIDCVFCDMNYIRREIPFVNYVRDVNEAELYIRESMQNTGSGGREYSYFFQGQNKFSGMQDTLVYATRPDDTMDHTRAGRTNMMKMGLMRYVAKTPIYKEVSIRHNGQIEEEEVIDKWNNWVFEIETRPRFESQESLKEFSIFNTFSARKITPDWKIEMEFDHRASRTKYKYEGEESINDVTNLSNENLLVKSLSKHWSAGARIELGTSTFSNTDFMVEFFPSVEYNLYPYSESTHRQLRFLYGAGYAYMDYIDSTIYNQVKEGHFKHSMEVAYQIQDRWGSVNISLEWSNYLHDFTKNRIELDGNLNIRITKGLSFNIRGNIARIHDQLSLSKVELSEADILLQLQEMATGYEVDGGLGITYTFGSIYNNIVNPRFGNGGGGFRRY